MDLLTFMVHLFAGGAFVFLIAALLHTQNQLRFVRWCGHAPNVMLRRIDRPTRYVLRFASAFGIPVEGVVPKKQREMPRVLDGATLFRVHMQRGISALHFSEQGGKLVCHLQVHKVLGEEADLIQRLEKELSLSFHLDGI